MRFSKGAHPGFKKVAESVEAAAEAKGMSEEHAKRYAFGGIANAARNASGAAKKANPRLRRVKKRAE